MADLSDYFSDQIYQPLMDHPFYVLLDLYFCQSCEQSVKTMHSEASGWFPKFEYEVFYTYICGWSLVLATEYSPLICWGIVQE